MKAVSDLTRRVRQHLNQGYPLWLFLDYDGTLADFAPTPEVVKPDPQLISILRQLSGQPDIRLTLISGRMLSQVRTLVPLNDIFLAGTYGVEVQLPGGEVIQRADLDSIRPVLERVKSAWDRLVRGLEGFFIEDKNWAIALHARFAEQETADRILPQAQRIAQSEIDRQDMQLLGGQRFLEIGPALANKGMTVAWLLDENPLQNALLLYLGDDDKDEKAFAVIHSAGGLSVLVGPRIEGSHADFHLKEPAEVRKLLREWLNHGGVWRFD
jgi:trehalose 6-phosphate phosphatase